MTLFTGAGSTEFISMTNEFSWAVIVIFTFVFFLSRHFPVGKIRRLVTLFYFEFISDLKKFEIEGRGNEFEILHIKKQKCSIPEEMQCL